MGEGVAYYGFSRYFVGTPHGWRLFDVVAVGSTTVIGAHTAKGTREVLKRTVTTGFAVVGWGLTVGDVLNLLPEPTDDALARLGLGVGIMATLQLMLWVRNRPLDAAYRLGCRDERKRVIKHMNQAPAPLRLASNDWDR